MNKIKENDLKILSIHKSSNPVLTMDINETVCLAERLQDEQD